MSAPETKSFESRIADLIRRFGTDFEGEAVAVWSALKRLLASRGVTFTDLGDAIEKLATGGLLQAEMDRIFAAAYAKGATDQARKHAETEAVFGLRPNGEPDWEAIAIALQREKGRIEAKHHQFIDDMAARTAWGREPIGKQGPYLLSLFRQIGGRIQ